MPENSPVNSSPDDLAVWDHKWGYADTKFVVNADKSVTLTGNRYSLCGYRMKQFIPYVESMLQVKLDLDDIKPEYGQPVVPASSINKMFCAAIKTTFTEKQYSFDDKVRLIHSHGQTSADEVYKVIYESISRVVDMVYFCQSEEDAQTIISLAKEHDVCLVPYGGGTSVSNALQLPANETRMIVSVDMLRMNKIEWIDKENFRACVQAGITGKKLEELLGEEGFMSGHEPDSIEFSTLGGWIATNASGMKKNRYGNIEQIIQSLTMITTEGTLSQLDTTPRMSMGMQPQHLLLGNEGNIGLITKAVIKIHKLPQVQKYGSIVFPDFESGVKFLYKLTHEGQPPSSIRLVDNVQFRFGLALKPEPKFLASILDKIKKFYLLKIKKFDPLKLAATTLVMEGTAIEVSQQEKSAYSIAKQFGGIPGGSENGRRGYLLTYCIAYIRDFLAGFHVIGETFETSVPWDKIHDVCRAVTEMVAKKHQEFNLPAKSYISYRITQTYHTGVCIYFMYGFYAKGISSPEKIFSKIEHELRQTILNNGGSISHHHGVGKLRMGFMKDILSPASIEMLKNLKRATDPNNIFGIQNNIFADQQSDA